MTASPTTPTRRLASTAFALLLLGGLTACGAEGEAEVRSGGSTTAPADVSTTDPGDDETTTTEDAPDTTVDEGDADAQAYADALVSTFDADEDGEVFTVDQVQCLAEGFVDVIGVDAFVDAGISPDDVAADDDVLDEMELTRETGNAMVDAFDGCDIDLRQTFLDALADQGLSAEQQSCVESALSEAVIRESFVNDLVGDDSGPDPLDAAESCFQPGG